MQKQVFDINAYKEDMLFQPCSPKKDIKPHLYLPGCGIGQIPISVLLLYYANTLKYYKEFPEEKELGQVWIRRLEEQIVFRKKNPYVSENRPEEKLPVVRCKPHKYLPGIRMKGAPMSFLLKLQQNTRKYYQEFPQEKKLGKHWVQVLEKEIKQQTQLKEKKKAVRARLQLKDREVSEGEVNAEIERLEVEERKWCGCKKFLTKLFDLRLFKKIDPRTLFSGRNRQQKETAPLIEKKPKRKKKKLK